MATRLADFILANMETIVARWEAFARTQLPAAAHMEALSLRDHAQQILEAVAKDLGTPQSREAQSAKSMGRAPKIIDAAETAAQTHALLRAQSGFDINQLAAEYRALRTSVLQLWIDDCLPEVPHPEDIIRFNEAIDQALMESIEFYSQRVEQSRNLFLGILGHDLRSPLQSIQMTATYLSALNAGEDISAAATRLINSGGRMKALLDDLLDYNRSQLGSGIPISPAHVDVAAALSQELDALRVAHPHRQLELEVVGDCCGTYDARRLQQLLGNLVVNAIKYGTSDQPVRVLVAGHDAEIRIEVKNSGTIDPLTRSRLFNPLSRGSQADDGQGSLGLGLYIVREIATAHGGDIDVHSVGTETTFAVRLPRYSGEEQTRLPA